MRKIGHKSTQEFVAPFWLEHDHHPDRAHRPTRRERLKSLLDSMMPVQSDAFQYTHAPTKRRSSRPPTRSPSPKIPFAMPTAVPRERKDSAGQLKALRKRGSREGTPLLRTQSFAPANGYGNGHASPASLSEIDELLSEQLQELEDLHDAEVKSERRQRRRASNEKPVETKKIDWEIPRKTLHSSIGAWFGLVVVDFTDKTGRATSTGVFVLPLYIYRFPLQPVIVSLSISLAVVATADLIRFRSKPFARNYERTLGFLMRDSEKVSLFPAAICQFRRSSAQRLTYVFRPKQTGSCGTLLVSSTSSLRSRLTLQ